MLSRRSIRKLSDKPIPAEQVQTLIEAAMLAPSSRGSRPWEFVVVEERSMLATLSRCKQSGATPLEGCKLAVVVCADPMKSGAWIEDCAIAAAYIQLQAHDLGLASCWVQIRDRVCTEDLGSEEYVSKYLKIDDNLRVECIIALGYPDEERPSTDPATLPWEKVHI